jgi:hypothetical protein
VLVSASRRNELSKDFTIRSVVERTEKSAMARTPSPALGTRALPNHWPFSGTYV